MGFYIPDRRMVKKLKEYDSRLSVDWDDRNGWWQIWYQTATGKKLITPVVESIYKKDGQVEYAPLDERIIAWLWHADSQRTSVDHHTKSYINNQIKKDVEFNRRASSNYRDLAKDAYSTINSFYTKKHQSKNPSVAQRLSQRSKKDGMKHSMVSKGSRVLSGRVA